jgi:hypothetical protein
MTRGSVAPGATVMVHVSVDWAVWYVVVLLWALVGWAVLLLAAFVVDRLHRHGDGRHIGPAGRRAHRPA